VESLNAGRAVTAALLLIAFVFIIAATGTPNWGSLKVQGSVVSQVGPYRSCTTNPNSCSSVAEGDVNDFCSTDPNNPNARKYPAKFCSSVRAARAFSVMAALLGGIATIIAIAAVFQAGAMLEYAAAAAAAVTGAFALIAFAVGYDAFVNQVAVGTLTATVDFSIGLMIIGWIVSWVGAAAGGFFGSKSTA